MSIKDKYLINESESLLSALKRLNEFGSSDSLTLFVIDNQAQLVGTITDGDIRRQLVNNCPLNSPLYKVMHSNFRYLKQGEINIHKLHQYKEEEITLIPILDEKKHIVDIINLKTHRSYLPIDAVLMAGGKGERLRPLTESTPKPLLKVGNKAIIDYNIERLISYGVKNISVTVNYLKEQLEEHFSRPILSTQINCVREPQFLGTIGSLKFVPKFHNDVILVMNSDLFTNINYEDFYLHFIEHNADMSVACIPYTVPIPYGIFELEGRIIKGIQEKPTYHFYANAGIYLIKKCLLSKIPENKFFNATDLIEALIKEKMKVIRFPLTGYWIDIGKHEEYNKAQELVKHLN